MEERANYIVVGFFIFFAIIAGIGFTVWLHQKHSSTTMIPYDVYFKSSVSGLSVGSPVKYKGILVGAVSKIDIAPKDIDKIRVRVMISGNTPVRAGSIASLEMTGITGESYIQLSGAEMDGPPLQPKKGQHVAVIPSGESSFDKIVHSVPELLDNADKLIKNAVHLLDKKNRDHIAHILENLDKVTTAVASKEKEVGEILTNTAHLTKALNQITSNVDGFIKDIRPHVRNFSENGLYEMTRTLNQFRHSLSRLDLFMENIENTLHEIMPQPEKRRYKLND